MTPKPSSNERVTVVDGAESATALKLSQSGIAVLVVGPDAAVVGDLVRAICDSDGRALAFVGDLTSSNEALAAMTAELFPDN